APAEQAPRFTTPGPEVAASTLEARRTFRAREATRLLQRLWLVSAASFRRADNLEQARCAIAEAEQSSAALPTWPLDYAGSWTGPTTLQFVPGSGSGHFEPFQPTNGRLIVHETDWFSVSQTRAIEAQRPELSGPATAPLAAGSHALKLADGPAGGVAVFALDLASPGTTTLLNLPGFAQPLWWNSSLMVSPMLVVEPLSPLGRAAIFVTNPGFVTPVPALAQVVTFSTDGVIGSSGEVAMTLQ
ncbi:MAG: hypothetical protein K8J09_07545, partial [Planctomycetes bacterium]|nr:hypothetical protein [Planctomycetota bacterium]